MLKNKKILICVTGGSGSGKSTISNEVFNLIPKNISKQILCIDNYYKSDESMLFEERKLLNYDHPNSFDFDLLKNDIKNLMNDIPIKNISYDYVNHIRKDNNSLIAPTQVIILEGIMSCWDKEIVALGSLNIFVDTPSDERFIRRLERDIYERGRLVKDVIFQWRNSVKPMYKEFIEPQKERVDIIIPWYKLNNKVLYSINGAIQELLKV